MCKWGRMLSVALLAAMMAGCGGGGGSQNPATAGSLNDASSGNPDAQSSGQGRGNPTGALEESKGSTDAFGGPGQ